MFWIPCILGELGWVEGDILKVMGLGWGEGGCRLGVYYMVFIIHLLHFGIMVAT